MCAHSWTGEGGRTFVLLQTIYQCNTQSALTAFKNKQIISPPLLMCNLACEKRSVEPFPFLLSAQLVEHALGRCPSQLLHPCAWREFCLKMHQIYFIPTYTPLGSSWKLAFWFRPLWNRVIVIFWNVTWDINDKISQRNNDISGNTVSPGTMLEH